MNFSNLVPGTMSAPAGVPSSQQAATAARTRDNMLCRRCRHDKQKCVPQDRDWEAGEKCRRCLDRGYECSALEKAPYKPRKRRTTSATVNSNTTARSPISRGGSVGMPILTPTRSEPAPTSSRPRPVIAWEAEVESMPSENIISVSHSDLENVATSARKSGEQDARMILAKLGDFHATRELLRRDLKLCDRVETWLGSSSHIDKIREAIKAVIVAIEAGFWTCCRETESFTKGKDIGPSKEAFLEKLGSIKYRFRFPVPIELLESIGPSGTADDNDDDDVQEELHELHKRKRIWSAADYLVGNASGRKSSRHPVHAHSEGEVVACFMKASDGIKDIFSEIVLEDAEHRQTLRIGFDQVKNAISAFPACHLAVAEASAHVLLALWKQPSISPWEVDYLARTPVHSAAYAGKLQGLSNIFTKYPKVVGNTGCDNFGLTPLAIAACRDDLQTFVKLSSNSEEYLNSSYTPDVFDKEGLPMSVLALAARNGSIKVVHYIMGHPSPSIFQQTMFTSPGSSELCQALLNSHVEVANVLIDCHSEQYDLTGQTSAAKALATRKGLDGIASRLDSLVPIRHDALFSLNEMAWDRFINFDSFADASTQYESSQPSTLQSFELDTPFWSSQGSQASSLTPYGVQSLDAPDSRPDSGFQSMSRSTRRQYGPSGP